MPSREHFERNYVRTDMWRWEEKHSLFPKDARWDQPPRWALLAMMAAFAIVLAAIILPFHTPFRERLGSYVYFHALLVAAGIVWFFWRVLPPPFEAKNWMHRSFARRLRSGSLRRVELDQSHVVTTRLIPPHSLEITMTQDWYARSHDQRLQDVQNLWRLWAYVYQHYEGQERAVIRILDPAGREVGGSNPQAGSLIWVEEHP